MIRPWIALSLCTLSLSVATPTLAQNVTASPDERLRLAWVEHRLRGELEDARAGYRAVAEDGTASPDLRARAHLGLAILSRDCGDHSTTREELSRVLAVPGASHRWRRTARLLRAELEGRPNPAGTEAPPDLLRELEEQVASLQEDLERVLKMGADREAELERKDRMLRRLQESKREEFSAHTIADRREEMERTDANWWLEELVRDDGQKKRLERSLIGSYLNRGREAIRDGRISEAHNEMKKILSLDPLHREALDLADRCRELLAATAGVSGFPSPAKEKFIPPPDLLVELTIDAMRAYLAEARRHLAAGRTHAAIRSASKVLEEHSWSPAILPEDVVREVVVEAERLLEECMGATATAKDSAVARELRERQIALIHKLRERFDHLIATQFALAEADESALRLVGRNDGEGSRSLTKEFAERMEAAEQALAAKRPDEAARHYRDLLLLLEWFPELDPEGTIAPDLAGQLAIIEGTTTP